MSTNTTLNLGMHSWAGNDFVQRQEFVDNFNIIDAEFDAATGHKHTGAPGDSPPVDVAGLAAAVITLIGTKAPLLSPALTGIPTVPTAAAGINTAQAASTAFVEAVRVILALAAATHQADYVRQPGYAIDTGTANHLLISLAPAPTSYADGMGIVAKVKVAGTGATDVNVNSLGIKPIFDSLGNAVTNFKANVTYSMKYESTSGNFIVQGKGGGGNALAGDVYTGKTATADSGPIVGTNLYKIGATIKDTNLSMPISATQQWALIDLIHATGIAVDTAGFVYVAYYNSGGITTVRKLNSAGVEQWANSDVSYAQAIAVDSEGFVYVAYNNPIGTTSVRKLTSAGVQVWALTTFNTVSGIAVDAAGFVYIVNSTGVRKLDSAGVQVWANSEVGNGKGIAVDTSGNVYVAYFNAAGGTTVRKLNSLGVQVWANLDTEYANGIAFDTAGNVYVAYSVGGGYTVAKLNNAGVRVWANADVGNAQSIAVDTFGNVYVTYYQEVGTISVRKFNSAGVQLWALTDVGEASGIAVDTAGFVYIAYYGMVRKLDGATYYTINA